MSGPETYITVDRFSGLNTRDAIGRIRDTELAECINYDIGYANELIKRTGFKRLTSGGTIGNFAVTLLGHFRTPTLSQILAFANSQLYQSTDGGTTWTLIAGGPYGNIEYGVQYNDKFYIVRRDAVILEWNGTTITAITGSPTGSFCAIYKDRLFVGNSYAAGTLASRLYFSKIADFSSTGWPSTNFIDVQPGDGDVLTSLGSNQDLLFVFKGSSTWLFYVSGDPVGWTLRNASPEIGCISRYTVKEIEGDLYFLSHRAAYRTDGNNFDEISAPVSPDFEDQILSTSTLNKSTAAWYRDKYIVLLQSNPQVAVWSSLEDDTWESITDQLWDNTTGRYTIYVYHIKAGAWSKWKPASTISIFNFVDIRQPSGSRGLLMGSRAADGRVYRYGDPVYNDENNDVAYECLINTKEFDLGSPHKLKRGKYLGVEYSSSGDHKVTNIVNSSARPEQSIPVTTGRKSHKVKGPGYFRVWQVQSKATHGNPIVFYGFTLVLHLKNEPIKTGV